MRIHTAEHLSKYEKVQLGGYYTSEKLVNKICDLIKPYLLNNKRNLVIFDSAGGCGAFLKNLREYDYRIADCDLKACEFLKEQFDISKIFHTNSLLNVRRDKYSISNHAFLVMIGNPPYNDMTSEFKNGEKGEIICDDDLRDRDLGISFLKSYKKLRANIVCVLHPLSYLIKETNFNRLKSFKDNYRLIKGEIFSSALFAGTGLTKFPILIALYENNEEGMTFDYIRNFKFNILESDKNFILSNYKTTDGYINKYPPRKTDEMKSLLGLYYYTFRDFNSLKKNASFFTREHPNGIIVTLGNFYQYAYLYSLKSLFNPEDSWLYGNLSPLINIEDVELNKKLYVLYTLNTHRVFTTDNKDLCNEIANYYEIKIEKTEHISKIEKEIKNKLNKLIQFKKRNINFIENNHSPQFQSCFRWK